MNYEKKKNVFKKIIINKKISKVLQSKNDNIVIKNKFKILYINIYQFILAN